MTKLIPGEPGSQTGAGRAAPVTKPISLCSLVTAPSRASQPDPGLGRGNLPLDDEEGDVVRAALGVDVISEDGVGEVVTSEQGAPH
jgi:hypothetical protein